MLRTRASSIRESPQQGRGVDDEFRFSPTIRAPIIPSIVARGDTALARAYSNASLSVILGVGYRQMTLLSLPTYSQRGAHLPGDVPQVFRHRRTRQGRPNDPAIPRVVHNPRVPPQIPYAPLRAR